MAIQAQYPSNILLLNRNIQEGKSPLGNDYSMKSYNGDGVFGDHNNMTFNHGVVTNNSRKRGREAAMTTPNAALESPLMSTQQQPQFIDLGLLYTPQKNVVSTGLGLAFDDPQQQQTRQQLPRQQHHLQKQLSLSSQSSSHSSLPLSLFSDELASHIKQQRDEMENFLLAQEEQLRRTLAEKRQRHYRILLNAAEESAAKKLREKEAEIGKAARRNAELEAKASQLSLEAQAWQTRARMQENYAAALQLQLQQAIMTSGEGRGGAVQGQNGEESGGGNSTGVVGGEAEDAESAYVDPDRVVVSSGPSCKACRKRVASVVVLPCRHLCICPDCDAVAQACPACLSIRSSSIEVFFS